MFSGIQELLLIVLIVLGIFFIPRMLKPHPPATPFQPPRPTAPLSWKFRLAVVISIFWPVAWALYFRPWHHNTIAYTAVGLGPVVLGWSLKWVLAGLKHRR